MDSVNKEEDRISYKNSESDSSDFEFEHANDLSGHDPNAGKKRIERRVTVLLCSLEQPTPAASSMSRLSSWVGKIWDKVKGHLPALLKKNGAVGHLIVLSSACVCLLFDFGGWSKYGVIISSALSMIYGVSQLESSYELSTTVIRGGMIALAAQFLGYPNVLWQMLACTAFFYIGLEFEVGRYVIPLIPGILGVTMTLITVNLGTEAGMWTLVVLAAPGLAAASKAMGFLATAHPFALGFVSVSLGGIFGGGSWGALAVIVLGGAGSGGILLGGLGSTVVISGVLGAIGIAILAKVLSLVLDVTFFNSSSNSSTSSWVTWGILMGFLVSGIFLARRVVWKFKGRQIVSQKAQKPQQLAKHGAILVYDHIYDYSEKGLVLLDASNKSRFTEEFKVGMTTCDELDFNQWVQSVKSEIFTGENYKAGSNNCLRFVQAACEKLEVQIPAELQSILNWLSNEGSDILDSLDTMTGSPVDFVNACCGLP